MLIELGFDELAEIILALNASRRFRAERGLDVDFIEITVDKLRMARTGVECLTSKTWTTRYLPGASV